MESENFGLKATKAAGAGGLVVLEDPLTFTLRSEIAAFASRLRLPAVYGYREFAEAGGLMSYGTNHDTHWRRGAEIVDLILKGAKPADIPVEQPTKFELVVNLMTAKALDLTVPATVLIRADKVIE
jgi:putative tryptophan/tyrosine transport system substrate-binding protein